MAKEGEDSTGADASTDSVDDEQVNDESVDGDAERLVAEALRAQAAQTSLPPTASETTDSHVTDTVRIATAPATKPATRPTVRIGQPDEAFQLISGTEYGKRFADTADPTAAATTPAGASTVELTRPSLPAGWVLLLAVLLGLAAGAVAGLLTIL